jgi:hypothetical protein
MKRLFFVLVVFITLFGMIGCVEQTTITTTPTTSTSTTSTNTSATTTTTTTTISVTTSSLTTTTTTAEENTDAILHGVEDVTIAVGEAFVKLDGVTAIDSDGTDLTAQISTSGIVNINRAGVYEVDYSVTGANGVTVIVTRYITVIDNARILGPETLPTSVLINTVFDPLLGVTAIDYDDEDLTDQITITGSIVNLDGTINTSTAGTYEIFYHVIGKSGLEVIIPFSLTIFEPGNAVVTFSGTTIDNPNEIELLLGMSMNIQIVASAKDYDGTDVTIDAIEFDVAYNALITNQVFVPVEAGEYQFSYKATGQNGVQSTTILTVKVIRQGIIIDGNYIPVTSANINNDGKPWNSTLIYTELKGMGEYGVLVIVDAHGRIVLVRDAYASQFDLTNPIKQGSPVQIRSIMNAVGWTGANVFNGILGPQGTPGGIPLGGFAIFFNRDNVAGTTHPTRLLGLLYGREIGAYVEVLGLSIPNYVAPTNDARIEGADDITIYDDIIFDPLERVEGFDFDGSPLTVSIVFNNIDMNKPVSGETDYRLEGFADGYFAVVYAVTGANGYTVHVTRRVTVLPALSDATILGIQDGSLAIGQSFDPLTGITAIDYNNADLTSQMTVQGTVDTQTAGVYVLTYQVTGANGVLVSLTRTITVNANARFVIDANRVSVIYVGATFNPWDGISALDHNDVDLTNLITLESTINVEGVINTSAIGNYTLLYKVTGESGNQVTIELNLNIIAIPNAQLSFESETNHKMFINSDFDLMANITAVDYDGSTLQGVVISFDPSLDLLVVNHIFTPVTEGDYSFTYSVTGANGVQVSIVLTVSVYASGVLIDGVAIPVIQANVNLPSGKPADTIMIFTELAGMGEFGVLVIVDAHGRIILVRDAFGEQMDVNNPFKSGNPAFPTNLSGLPNFKTYDAYTGGLWTAWVRGGADTFEGLLGTQGTPGGIPTGGFAIYFQNGTTSRPLGLKFAREYGALVEVVNLLIPNYDGAANDLDATILGASDIEISANSIFDPLAGVSGVDANNDPLVVTVVFTNVNTAKPVLSPQPARVVNTVDGRNAYAQGWYSVVYSVTGANGYTVHVSRRVTVR